MSVIVISGAGSGIGALSARSLARAGHTVYAGLRDIGGRNAGRVQRLRADAEESALDLRPLELDVLSQESTDRAIALVLTEQDRIDVVMHNAGHMTLGPAEAFTAEEVMSVFDTNVLGSQRLNRSALPVLRGQHSGLVLWVSSSSVKGGTPPFLGPYFAAKAAMDSIAVSYAAELLRWGVETSILVPGAFPSGTDHFASATGPADSQRIAAYDTLYSGMSEQVGATLAAETPEWADVQLVADAVVAIVNAPSGSRPFRVHVDPLDDGSEAVSAVADDNHRQFLERIHLSDLNVPTAEPAASL
ncbi:SDR family oxidoreductase [Naasia lichenicola]|uniref:SDR family oxidoreductase n=1 Tax=Naasia lichenicola TaxID=2565933 RepID=A0A4S4FMP3_9MICO|nr:SDR family oxidoreductase [Naasia lichenicola]THG31518.1 SDR family oxidoreductase [Naasia lichenicola]